jgi:hypothetical protein
MGQAEAGKALSSFIFFMQAPFACYAYFVLSFFVKVFCFFHLFDFLGHEFLKK